MDKFYVSFGGSNYLVHDANNRVDVVQTFLSEYSFDDHWVLEGESAAYYLADLFIAQKNGEIS